MLLILTGSPRKWHGKPGHSHLHWQHNVINCMMWQKFYRPHPTPLPITDYSLYFFKTRFLTWSPLVFITSCTTYLESHSFCRKCHQTNAITFCQFVEVYQSKNYLFPNFPLIIEINKYRFLAPLLMVFPPPQPLTPPTLHKR